MIIEVDGQRFDVPDDATPDEIDQLTAPATAPQAPKASLAESAVAGGEQGISAGFSDELRGIGRAVQRGGLSGRILASAVPALSAILTQPDPVVEKELKEKTAGKSLGEQFRMALTGVRKSEPTLAGLITGEKPESFASDYRAGRDYERARLAGLQEANPKAFMTGEIAGAVAGGGRGLLTKGASLAKRLAMGAGQGAVQGAGFSNASDVAGAVGDTALGAGVGLAGNAIGEGLGKAASWLRGKGSKLVQRGTERAAQQAAEESSAAVRSLEGAARERAANAYRQMERINIALNDPSLPAAERAALEAFKRSAEYADLVAANAKGVLGAAPDALAEREAAAAIAQAAREELPEAMKARAAELLKTQGKADLKSLLKAYAEPIAWGLAGQQAASALGMSPYQQFLAGSVLGAIGGRTRAGKAIWTRINRPAHQVAIGQAMNSLGGVGSNGGVMSQVLQRLMTRGVPAAATAGLVTSGQEEE